MPENIELSLVIPLFNEADNITPLYKAIIPVLHMINKPAEIIFVDDGSRDHSFELVKYISTQDPRVRGISLSRNFGHQVALTAGLQHARGNLIVTLDADLRNPPDVIPLLIEQYNQGNDIVNTRRIEDSSRGTFRKISSSFIFKLLNRIADIPADSSSSDFRLMSRKVLDSFLQFRERDRFNRALMSWMGFRQTEVDYEIPPVLTGKSKHYLRKMIRFAAGAITSFSPKPLRIASYVGFTVFMIGLGFAIFIFIQHISGILISGWTLLLVIVLLLSGIQLMCLSVIGEYLAHIFNESKSRPLYFIKERTN